MTTYIVSSGVTSGIRLYKSDTMSVFGSGSSLDIIISGGNEFISAGGISDASFIASGGSETVFSGGLANGTYIYDIGSLTISAGGSASNTSVGYLCRFSVTSGASAFATQSESGDIEVANGGFVSGVTLKFDGSLYLKGSALGVVVGSGGLDVVLSGGVEHKTVVEPGYQYVDKLGASYGTILESGAIQQITGLASSTLVHSGASETINSGGTAYGSIIDAGGVVIVSSGGVSENANFKSGGLETIVSGGLASDTRVKQASIAVSSGGSARSVTLDFGGDLVVSSGGKAFDTMIDKGGHLVVIQGGKFHNATINGGKLAIKSEYVTSGDITFEGSGGVLRIKSTAMPAGRISGFQAGDVIELESVPYAPSDKVSVNLPGLVTISARGYDYSLNIAGAKVGETDFVFGSGSILTKMAPAAMAFIRPVADETPAFMAAATTVHMMNATIQASAASGSFGVVRETAIKPDTALTALILSATAQAF